MLGVVVQQRPAELDDGRDALVGQPVIDAPVLAPGHHEAAPTQAGEVVRDLRLGLIEELDELADPPLAFRNELQDPEPGAIAEDAEVLGEQIAFSESGREPEGGVRKWGFHPVDDTESSDSCGL